MKNETKLRSSRTILTVVLLLVGACLQARAQNPTTQNPVEPAENRVNQASQIPNLRPLSLTPEQIQKIRDINADMNEQRQAANLKVRQANRALTEAVESPTPNQALIEQRSRELADAQVGIIRLRSLIEARVLQEVLTPEQRIRLREMRQRNQALRRDGSQLPRNGLGRRPDGLQRNTNTPSPLTPRQRRLIRQQRPKP